MSSKQNASMRFNNSLAYILTTAKNRGALTVELYPLKEEDNTVKEADKRFKLVE